MVQKLWRQVTQAVRPTPTAVFIAIDELGQRIQEAVSELASMTGPARLPRRSPGFRPQKDPAFEGFCARMCEAYVFLVGDPRTLGLGGSTLQPRTVRHSKVRGDSHYWLECDRGIMDLNFGPSDDFDPGYCDYAEGHYPTRVKGFRPWERDERYPSNADARKIMDAVWDRLDRESSHPAD